MLEQILNNINEVAEFQVVRLVLKGDSPKELTDQLNAANVQGDMNLLTTEYVSETKELYMFFVRNSQSSSKVLGNVFEGLLNINDNLEQEENIEVLDEEE